MCGRGLPCDLSPRMPPDVRRVVTGRAIRGFADGFVSVLLAQYLTGLGFSPGRRSAPSSPARCSARRRSRWASA